MCGPHGGEAAAWQPPRSVAPRNARKVKRPSIKKSPKTLVCDSPALPTGGRVPSPKTGTHSVHDFRDGTAQILCFPSICQAWSQNVGRITARKLVPQSCCIFAPKIIPEPAHAKPLDQHKPRTDLNKDFVDMAQCLLRSVVILNGRACPAFGFSVVARSMHFLSMLERLR